MSDSKFWHKYKKYKEKYLLTLQQGGDPEPLTVDFYDCWTKKFLKTITLDAVPADAKFSLVKQMIHDKEGILVMELYHAGQKVPRGLGTDDSETLADYNIRKNLQACIDPNQSEPRMIVKIVETTELEVDPLCTIRELKELIQDKKGIHIGSQTLTFGGRGLNEDWMLADYGIQNESKILLTQEGQGEW